MAEDTKTPTLKEVQAVLALAVADGDDFLIGACERVAHDLNTGETTAFVGDWMMVAEAQD